MARAEVQPASSKSSWKTDLDRHVEKEEEVRKESENKGKESKRKDRVRERGGQRE